MIVEKIIALTKQLYPKGRAFKIFAGGWYDRLHAGLAESETRAYNDAIGILNSILPDNSSFTTTDATDWERRLGLINGSANSLTDRKLAIQRKMNHPGNIKARQNWRYIEEQLHAAGFLRLYVFENTNLVDPLGALPAVNYGEMGEFEHGKFEHGDNFSYYAHMFTFNEHGVFEHGVAEHAGWILNSQIVNFLDADLDALFDVTELQQTFFICDIVFGNIATIQASRELEFRQLVLKLKPVGMVAYPLVKFV